jgi:hypothetical protein
MNFYTYIFRDPLRNLEPFYVGKGKEGRVLQKKNSQVERRRKLISDAGLIENIEIINAINEEHAHFLEECLISIFGTRPVVTGVKRGSLWNFTKGGEGTAGMNPWNKGIKTGPTGKKRPHTEETKLKISIANTGQKRKPHTIETINKMSQVKLNKSRTEETKLKISNSLLGKKKGISTGPLSANHRENISNSKKGKPWTESRRLAQRTKNDKF